MVYKLVKIKRDNKLYPLFIDKDRPFEIGKWMRSKYCPTKGFAKRSIGQNEDCSEKGGWHITFKPLAPHLSMKLANGEKRVWLECESKGDVKKYNRPESQGGTWGLVEFLKPLRVLTQEEVEEILHG